MSHIGQDASSGTVLIWNGTRWVSTSLSGYYARDGSTGAMTANVDFDTFAAVWENEPVIAPFNGGFGTYTLPGLGPADTGAILMGGGGSTSEFNSEARWYTESAGSKILRLNPGNATSGNVSIFSGTEKARFGFNNALNRVEIAATGTAPLYLKNNGVSWAWPTADGTTGQVLQTDGSGVTSWVTVSSVSPGGAPVNVTKATAEAGSSALYARQDHKHDISTAAAVSLTVGGSNAEGTTTTLARSDHTHALPAFGTTAGTFTEGNDSRLSNDRTASGIRTATTVVAVSSATAPLAGYVLQATSSTAAQWAPVSATAGGSDTQVQFNSSGALAGDPQFTWDSANNRLVIDSGSIRITSSFLEIGELTAPSTPTSTRVSLYQENQANRYKLARIDEYGLKQFIQDSMERQSYSFWKPPGNSTTVPGVFGFAAMTATGTATARNIATTRYFTRLKRLAYVSAATAGSLAGPRLAVAQYTIGAGGTPAVGGFYACTVFGCSDAATVAGARQFVGVSNSTAAPTNVEPSTLTNVVGVGHGAADTNLKLFYGGSAAQTPIDLGVNFPANTLSVDAYELVIWCPPTLQQVNWKVTRLNTGDVASGTLSGTVGTAFPATTTLLTPVQAWRSNNATALAVGLDIMSIYVYGNN